MTTLPLEQALDARVTGILERCTSCGACAEVCPMPSPAGIDANPRALTSGVLALLRGEEHPADSARWAAVCTGSGHCIPACQYGVNPRFMLAMARLAMAKRKEPANRRRDGFTRFTGMTTGVRVLSRLQLSPELLARFRAETDSEEAPDVVFYTGCNLLRRRTSRCSVSTSWMRWASAIA
jgi:heterodisulfide reductase subunit D